jgi:hypothetical protein
MAADRFRLVLMVETGAEEGLEIRVACDVGVVVDTPVIREQFFLAMFSHEGLQRSAYCRGVQGNSVVPAAIVRIQDIVVERGEQLPGMADEGEGEGEGEGKDT